MSRRCVPGTLALLRFEPGPAVRADSAEAVIFPHQHIAPQAAASLRLAGLARATSAIAALGLAHRISRFGANGHECPE